MQNHKDAQSNYLIRFSRQIILIPIKSYTFTPKVYVLLNDSYAFWPNVYVFLTGSYAFSTKVYVLLKDFNYFQWSIGFQWFGLSFKGFAMSFVDCQCIIIERNPKICNVFSLGFSDFQLFCIVCWFSIDIIH